MFIDHDATFGIIKQTLLLILSLDRLNFRLIRVFDYIQRFNLLIRHKFGKLHSTSDALFRLSINNIVSFNFDDDELNILFTIILIEMTFDFRKQIFTEYVENSV